MAPSLGQRLLTGTAAAVAVAVAVSLAGPASASPTATGEREQRLSRGDVDRADAEALRPAEQAAQEAQGADDLKVTASAQALPTPGMCPVGYVQKPVLTESFEDGLHPDYHLGWSTVAHADDAAHGKVWIESRIAATDVEANNFVFLDEAAVRPGTRTYLSFATRGSFAADSAFVLVNDSVWVADTASDSDTWEHYVIDVTAETSTFDGYMDIWFDHWPQSSLVQDELWELDDVRLYSCLAPPASGVRGDWTGEGTVDLLVTLPDGTLGMYEGNGRGAVRNGRQVGVGWAGSSWIGSPGDVDGDRRTDLLARRDDGTLWLYRGRGGGGFFSAVKVGVGWNSLTAIATPGDMTGDGRPDLLGRRADGTLHLYSFSGTTTLRYVKKVGVGWGSMTSIVGVGDITGDRLGDLLAVRQDGTMYAWSGSARGLKSIGRVGPGWGAMTAITSPGDLNGDGRGDVLARRPNGTLWFYAGKATGVVSGKQVGVGWNDFDRLL